MGYICGETCEPLVGWLVEEQKQKKHEILCAAFVSDLDVLMSCCECNGRDAAPVGSCVALECVTLERAFTLQVAPGHTYLMTRELLPSA